ncbi:hypothetical protein [Methylobacterium planeticum]|uniref:Uncharacterized protein n=1 Tax=Methylobacterium planeticum TaxID=2615211 RepID=A0A6N6MJK5_9HYPH|nr:hypothetical protein [Methylobacterium planeticum]KAB1069264.1 hypothetical protein F6X51_25660 [Methylobacterium planeticum]
MRRYSSKLALLATTSAQAVANASAGLPSAVASITAGEAIAKGDLIVQGGDALAYWAADPAAPGASLRPLALASDAMMSLQMATISPFAGQAPAFAASCVLTNGNVAVFSLATSGANSGFIIGSIYTPQGVLVAGSLKLALGDATSNIDFKVYAVALTGGGFALGLTSRTNNFPSVTTYDASGALVGSQVFLETNTFRAYAMQLTALQNGGYAVAWYTTTGFQVKLAFFNASGVQQGSTIIVGTAPNQPNNYYAELLRLVTLTSGNVAVVWQSGGVSGNMFVRLAIYSQVGGVAVPDFATGLVKGGVTVSDVLNLQAIALTDGGLGIRLAQNGGHYFAKYSGLGILVGTQYTLDTNPNTVVGVLVALPGGLTFWAASTTTGTPPAGYTRWGVVGADGNALVAATAPTVNGATTSGNGYVYATMLQNGDLLLVVEGAASTAYGVRFGLVSGVYAQKDSGTLFPVSVATLISATLATPLATLADAASLAGNAFIVYAVGSLAIVNALVQKRSLIGVAQAAAVKGAQVAVQILGGIATRLNFVKPLQVDQSAAALPGQKMSVTGNMAVLKGIQP